MVFLLRATVRQALPVEHHFQRHRQAWRKHVGVAAPHAEEAADGCLDAQQSGPHTEILQVRAKVMQGGCISSSLQQGCSQQQQSAAGVAAAVRQSSGCLTVMHTGCTS